MAVDTVEIPRNYADAIQMMAQWHGEDAEPDLEIYSFRDPAESTVRFVEISDGFGSEGEVRPITFGRSATYPYALSVALVTRDDWRRIQEGDLWLPPGWDLATSQQVWPRG